MFKSQSQFCPTLGTPKILGLCYPYWARGDAEVVKLKISKLSLIFVPLIENRYDCNAVDFFGYTPIKV